MAGPRFAQSQDDLLGEDQIRAMSGLDFMRGILSGDLPPPPIAQTLNYELIAVDEGRVTFRATPCFEAMNMLGAMHGGWYGTLLDSAMACAVQTTLAKGDVYTTLEYKVNILRPLRAGGEDVLAMGHIDHSGRRTAVAHGEIRGAETDKLIATGTTTCLIL